MKSAIRRELIRLAREKEKEEALAKKREEIARLMAESPGMEISDEMFLGKSREKLVHCLRIYKSVFINNKFLA